jgi:hypothetical protein
LPLAQLRSRISPANPKITNANSTKNNFGESARGSDKRNANPSERQRRSAHLLMVDAMATTGDAPFALLPSAHDGSGKAGDALNAMTDPSPPLRGSKRYLGAEEALLPQNPGSWALVLVPLLALSTSPAWESAIKKRCFFLSLPRIILLFFIRHSAFILFS